MRGVGDVANREHAAAGRLHVAVDREITERVGRERKFGEPGFVGIWPIAEQHNHMVGLDLAAALQADGTADPAWSSAATVRSVITLAIPAA